MTVPVVSESNHSGSFLERQVELELRARGVMCRGYDEDRDNYDMFSAIWLIKRVPYKSLYGTEATSEFVLQVQERRIRIECRVQETPGSVDEKFPYLYMNARDYMPEKEIVLVLSGNGARERAVDWLKRACDKVEHKRITVCSDWAEFRAWLKATLPK